jgi:hypothetical protein
MQGQLQCQQHRTGSEADSPLRQRQLQIRLSTDITSQGDRIYGNWSEASRNIFGTLQGTAGGGQIEVFVEASGFAASVTSRTTGSKQTVQISSKGEIRSVNSTMSKGG